MSSQNSESKVQNVAIAGAGLVGSLLAIFLRKRHYNVEIYERRPDARVNKLYAGRSINLALSTRGWKALKTAGLQEVVQKMAIPMYRRVMHDNRGQLTYQPYGKSGEAIYSVSRGGLNKLLMDKAERHGVHINFEHKLEQVDFKTAEAQFEDVARQERTTVKPDALIGGDGAFSAVRRNMQFTDRFSYSQNFIEHGYKELTIPATAEGKHQMEQNALHIWPRGHYMLIALPNPDGSFTCTLFFPYEGNPSFASLPDAVSARRFFEEQFPDALALMPHFDAEWEENPNASLVIIRCFPWSRNGKVGLIGDASHAIVPFYGQGMNSGFEDCTVMDEMLEHFGHNWQDLWDSFERQRKPDADAISELAMRNFVEMRDLTGDADFLLRKKIESRFSEKYPDKWQPLYSLVTFSHTRYSEALALGKKQDELMQEIMNIPDIHHKWDSSEVEEKMLTLADKLRSNSGVARAEQ